MKKILILLMLCGATLQAQTGKDSIPTSTSKHQVILGYGANVLGKNAHLLYGYQLGHGLFYGGLRWQENAFYNPMFPEGHLVFRHDHGGAPLGLILGFQQNFPLRNFGITPLVFADMEYAYLHSSEPTVPRIINGQEVQDIWETPARSLYVPAMGLGFEANIYKGLHMKQVIGVNALFDDRRARFSIPEFNGLNFTVRLSLLYKF